MFDQFIKKQLNADEQEMPAAENTAEATTATTNSTV